MTDDAAWFEALGRMVVAIRDLEHCSQNVARALAVKDPERKSASHALEAAAAQVERGLPPWSWDLDAQRVTAWISAVLGALEERNMYVHWRETSIRKRGDWVRYRVSPREPLYQRKARPAVEVEVDAFDQLRCTAHTLTNDGHAVHQRLLYRVRDGLYLPHPALMDRSATGAVAVYVYAQDGVDPGDGMASEEERQAWWDWLGQGSPPPWQWPFERFETQERKRPSPG